MKEQELREWNAKIEIMLERIKSLDSKNKEY